MSKPVFDIAELDRLIEQEQAEHAAYNAAQIEVEELRQKLKEKEAALESLNKFPRWGMSKAAQYTSNYIADKLQALSKSKGGQS